MLNTLLDQIPVLICEDKIILLLSCACIFATWDWYRFGVISAVEMVTFPFWDV